MNLTPVEDECGARVGIKLLGFARVIVGVKDKAAMIELLEKDDASGGDAVRGGGGKGHDFGLLDALADDRFLEPFLKLLKRVLIY